MAEPATWLSTVDELRELRAQLDAEGKKLVFTNGCFDLLHAGHVRYLSQTRALGDALVVALNSDASTRALKGPSRPVNTQDDRAEILRALRSVDRVIVFDEPRVTKLIEAIKPHVYAKGGDYTIDSLNAEERAALESVGAKIEIIPLVPGRSTTATLTRVAQKEITAENPEKLRLGILGSGHGSNFEAIQRAIRDGILNAEISIVISDVADSRIMRVARELGLRVAFVDPGPDLKRFSEPAQREICDQLKRHRVQVVVLTGFMRMVKDPTLSEFAGRIINIHPSLLPKFKGRNAWVQALAAGETETGCTVHLVERDLDAGLILAQEKVPIHTGDSAEALYQRLQEQEHKLLPRVLSEWRARGLPVG